MRSAVKNAKIAKDVESSWPVFVKDIFNQKRKGDQRRLEGSRRSDVKRSLATSQTRGGDQNLFGGCGGRWTTDDDRVSKQGQ
uniref:CaATP_NAI domain-containing protein n=1 Tax=Caenorhabditis tropicalis TaxID=1561998 RepID=A0A1I7TBS7_9PELO